MNPLSSKIKAKITIICGVSGSRKDFVAGWLGHCDGFVDTQWRVNPTVGNSSLNNYGWSIVDIFDAIDRGDLLPDAESNRSIALTCHVPPTLQGANNLDKIDEFVKTNAINIAWINLNGGDMIQYHWDKIVKAYLFRGIPTYDFMRDVNTHTLSASFNTGDQVVTDEIAVAHVKRLIRRSLDMRDLPGEQQDGQYLHYRNLDGFATTQIEYSKLFQEGGSHYLCNTLGTTASERLHNYWNALLPFINAPDTCTAFGREWSKSMLIK